MRAAAPLAFVFLAAACQAAPPEASLSDADRELVRTEVMDWANQWLQNVQTANADGALALMDPTASHFVDGGSYFQGFEEFQNNTRAVFSTWESNEGDWTRTRVDVLGPDAAVFFGDRSAQVVRTDGSTWDVRSLSTFVLSKENGEWKGIHGHTTSAWTPHM